MAFPGPPAPDPGPFATGATGCRPLASGHARIYVAKASSGRGSKGSWLWRMRKMTSLLFFGLAPMKSGVWRSEVWSLRAQALRAIPPNNPNPRGTPTSHGIATGPYGVHVSPFFCLAPMGSGVWRSEVWSLRAQALRAIPPTSPKPNGTPTSHGIATGPYGVHVSPFSLGPYEIWSLEV